MLIASPKRSVRFLMALLVLWGTSGQALSAILCGAGFCGDACGMRAARPVARLLAANPTADAKSKDDAVGACCQKKAKRGPAADSPSKRGASEGTKQRCCCKVGKADFPLSSQAKSNSVSAAPVLDLPVSVPSVEIVARKPIEERWIEYADSSPPLVAWHPDFGRAPPSA